MKPMRCCLFFLFLQRRDASYRIATVVATVIATVVASVIAIGISTDGKLGRNEGCVFLRSKEAIGWWKLETEGVGGK